MLTSFNRVQTLALNTLLVNGYNMPFPKPQLFVQSHSVNLSTKNRALLFAEKLNSKFDAVVPQPHPLHS